MAMNVVMLVAEGAAEGGEALRELPMPAYLYGVIALVLFVLALAVTWAFRGTAPKLGKPASGHDAPAGSGHH